MIVLHPRTANPIQNPYLKVRDAAIKTINATHTEAADFLWKSYPA